MGRRPDSPAMQKAKGNPGRRISRQQREAAERNAAAAELAAQPVGTSVEPPERLRGENYAGALAVWRELGPELERTNRLQPVHRHAFAMFCIYIAEWWQACDDLAAGGRSQHVKTVAGGSMERDRPAVRWRAEAYSAAMDAAKHFGLTPREEYALFKDQSTVVRENPGLFGRGSAAPDAANDAAPAGPIKTIGRLSSLKSEPPPSPVRAH